VGTSRDSDLPEQLAEVGRRVGQALADALDSVRPAFEAVSNAVNRPEVQAMVDRAERLIRRRPCLCSCVKAHPEDQSICELWDAVVTGQYSSDFFGEVGVPLCAPCAAARAAREFVS
jgi:hypothetical protein